MAWTDNSEWQTTSATGNIPGKTPKQEAMLSATSPMAGNARNTGDTSRRDGTAPRTAEERAATEQTAGEQQQAQQKQQKQQQQASGAPDVVSNVASKLGNFGYMLREKVNKFLTAGASNIGMQNLSTAQYGPEGVKIQDKTEQVMEPVIQEKEAQAQNIRGVLSPFAKDVAGKLYGKQFDEVLRDIAAQDPTMAQHLPKMLQMVQMLQQMEANGQEDSPEARALEAQLEMQDTTGMVSGLKRAMDDYNRIMGLGSKQDEALKWYGDAGDTGYSALDLANLGQGDIRGEVEKSLLSASGLFGGDFEENLQKLYDTESEDVRRSNREKELLQAELSKAMTAFTQEYGGKFQQARTQLNDIYRKAADSLVQTLSNSGNTKLAVAWAEAFSEGKDLEDVLYASMSDPNSGLNPEQKKAIANYIGGLKENALGEFGAWMDSLSKRGVINAVVGTDDQGKPIRQDVELSAVQKMEILRTLQSEASPQEKEARVRDIIGSTTVGSSTMKDQVQSALDVALKTGDTQAAASDFSQSMMNSMQTFMKSRTEDVTRQVLGISAQDWAKMNPDQKAAALQQAMQDPNFVKQLKQDAATKTAAEKQQLESVAKEWNAKLALKKQELEQFKASAQAQLQQVQAQPQVALQELEDQIRSRFSIGNVETTQNALLKSPRIKMLMAQGKLNVRQLVDVAKAFNYYAAYRDLAAQDPEVADAVYGGAVYAATVNPQTLLDRGDVEGLLNLVAETDKALVKDSGQLADFLGRYYQKASSGRVATSLGQKIREFSTQNSKVAADIQKAMTGATVAFSQVQAADRNLQTWVKQIDQTVFDPQQLIAVALGAGNQQGVGFTQQAQAGSIPGSAIVADDQGVPYVKMGDGRYVPIDLSKLPGMQAALAKGAGVGALPVSTPKGFQTEVGTGADPLSGVDTSLPTPAQFPREQPPAPAREESPAPSTRGTQAGQVWKVPMTNGTVATVEIPPGYKPEEYIEQHIPGADLYGSAPAPRENERPTHETPEKSSPAESMAERSDRRGKD